MSSALKDKFYYGPLRIGARYCPRKASPRPSTQNRALSNADSSIVPAFGERQNMTPEELAQLRALPCTFEKGLAPEGDCDAAASESDVALKPGRKPAKRSDLVFREEIWQAGTPPVQIRHQQ
jgi:hypothetical protein